MSAPKPPGIQDCAHGYYDGMGCGLCGDPVRQRDAEIATLRAERDALRRALAELHAITPEEDRKWLAEAAYWETMYREAADDAARIRGSYGKGT